MKKLILSFCLLFVFFVLQNPVQALATGECSATINPTSITDGEVTPISVTVNNLSQYNLNDMYFSSSEPHTFYPSNPVDSVGSNNFTWNGSLPDQYTVRYQNGVLYAYNDSHTFTFSAVNITPNVSPVINVSSEYWANGCSVTVPLTTPTPTPTPTSIKIVASPTSGTKTIGTPFSMNVAINSEGEAFNAARSTVSVSSNLTVNSISAPSSNACNLQYTQAPTTSNPSFAGAIFGGSSTACNVYTMVVTPNASGTGTITFTNGSIKSYANNSEILTGVTNASFTLGDAPTPTPTTVLDFTIANVLPTYHTSYTLTGTKLASLTKIFVNSSDANSTYPTSTTWQNIASLTLGNNNFAVYGSDDNNNQTATQTVSVSRHTLGDIDGDGVINLVDASLFAVDWDKTSNLTYNLSDMNDDDVVNLTDLSILAKLE